MSKQLLPIGVDAAAQAIARGAVTPEELTRACLERITERESSVGAWAFLDPQHALQQAQRADRFRRAGRDIGVLHGVPIGVADLFDSKDMPCERGSALYQDRRTGKDSRVVALLRAAGAVLPGKCATSELGVLAPGKTLHPRSPGHRITGGAAGAAAAVADDMLPAAVALQGEGELIQAAAQCGIVGFVPSPGLISRTGATLRSPTLDRVGVLTRSLEDAALLARSLMAYDDEDGGMSPHAAPRLVNSVQTQPPVPPRFGRVRSPWTKNANEAMMSAFAELTEVLNEHADTEEFVLGPSYEQAPDWVNTLFNAELANTLFPEPNDVEQALSPALQGRLELGRSIRAVDYLWALRERERLRQQLEDVFIWCDALILPATLGPVGTEDECVPDLFAVPWQLLGLPVLSLPLFETEHSLPMGVQLVGAPLGDGRLLRTANWLLHKVVDTG